MAGTCARGAAALPACRSSNAFSPRGHGRRVIPHLRSALVACSHDAHARGTLRLRFLTMVFTCACGLVRCTTSHSGGAPSGASAGSDGGTAAGPDAGTADGGWKVAYREDFEALTAPAVSWQADPIP